MQETWEFIDAVRRECKAGGRLAGLFEPGRRIVIARAPGRLDLMGGIADYSGSLVLQWPLRVATFAAVQVVRAVEFRVVSLPAGDTGRLRVFELSCAEFQDMLRQSYDDLRAYFAARPADAWAAYVLGTAAVLAGARHLEFDGALRILVASSVPEGKGVSSSAALEVATMTALARLLDVELPGTELARLCQMAENLVVGAPCGIMDQMTAALGREGELLRLLCQPAELQGFLPLPAELAVWGLDSGIRHAVSGSDYTSVRVGAFMGYRIIAELAALPIAEQLDDCHVCIEDGRWRGYLANITAAEFEAEFAEHLPEAISGTEFLEHYGGTTDTVTRVEPGRVYAVRQPTAHPIYEHARVREFAELLEQPADERTCRRLGELMYESHASYSACGLGSDGTDLLVELVRRRGPAAGLYGAKITGGGSGGTVAVLGRPDAHTAVERIAADYAERTGRSTTLFSGSSNGSYNVPVVELTL